MDHPRVRLCPVFVVMAGLDEFLGALAEEMARQRTESGG